MDHVTRRAARYAISTYRRDCFAIPAATLFTAPRLMRCRRKCSTRVTERLTRVLKGEDNSDDFAHLSAATRRQILEILQDTKPDLFSKSTSES